jgi:N-acyl-L-homoserine lactone synthetase
MQVISGVSEAFLAGVFPGILRYRHKVFVEQLGWELFTENGMEQDQFDRPDTMYVVAQDETGDISGCARLLPTTHPYLLGEVFPQLLNGLTPPRSSDVWELSRFAAVDFNSQNSSALSQFSSPIAIRLLKESIACAAKNGVKRIITVSPIGVERLLRKAGFQTHRAGPPMVIDGHPIFACWIEVEQSCHTRLKLGENRLN